jgi:hypothetical protein
MIDDSNGNGAGHERRKSPRAPLAVALEISGENNRQYPGKGFVTNLSEGGLAWETPHVFSQGEAVLIRFSLHRKNRSTCAVKCSTRKKVCSRARTVPGSATCTRKFSRRSVVLSVPGRVTESRATGLRF